MLFLGTKERRKKKKKSTHTHTHLNVSGGSEAVSFVSEAGDLKALAGGSALGCPGHELREMILPTALEHHGHAYRRNQTQPSVSTLILYAEDMPGMKLAIKTFLFLADFLYQCADLDVLLPLLSWRWSCTAAFWETQRWI